MGSEEASVVMASLFPLWDGKVEARTLEVTGGGGGPTRSAIFGWREAWVATSLVSATGSALGFLRPALAVVDTARGFRVFFSLASVAVELPVFVAEILFFRGFLTAGVAEFPLALAALAATSDRAPASSLITSGSDRFGNANVASDGAECTAIACWGESGDLGGEERPGEVLEVRTASSSGARSVGIAPRPHPRSASARYSYKELRVLLNTPPASARAMQFVISISVILVDPSPGEPERLRKSR